MALRVLDHTKCVNILMTNRNQTFDLKQDATFITDGLRHARDEYERKLGKSNTSEEVNIELSWNVVGYEGLDKELQKLCGAVEEISKLLVEPLSMKADVKNKLQHFRTDITKYLKELYSKKRKAATYLMVFMVADEQRNLKPYAVPIQVMPYHSITDAKLRNLVDEIKRVMSNLDMTVVGVVTDGEFNSLRTQGSERPISIIQLISDARSEARSMKARRLTNILKPMHDGTPLEVHTAVPLEDVQFVHSLQLDGVAFHTALELLKRKLFPFSYNPCTWIAGKTETNQDTMRSLMAIYLFREKVQQLKQLGVDFDKHLFVPEEENKEQVHQREDHNHLLKRIVGCMRECKILGVDTTYLKDALSDPDSGLTYEALTGKNKQSVPDCERLISPGVIAYMEKRGHHSEKEVLTLLHNWHKAVDGRGLSEETRSRYCHNLKAWILKDWIPYLNQVDNYSFIDVNRPIKGICGLTREVIVGLVANLESREQRRSEYLVRDLPVEHPRASSTDDVEGFIALLHQMLGLHFDLKQFYDEFPKIMNEFIKKIDPDLPFYYWTGQNTRYRDFELQSFNEPSQGGIERLDKVRISRRGDPAIFGANRASLPQKNQLTVRANFHRAPVALPPVNNI